MNENDLVTMIDRLGQSLGPVQRMLSGFGYVLGIVFFIIAIKKFHKIGNARAMSSSGERMIVPVAYLGIGALLVYFPSTMDVIRSTVFGTDSPISYDASSGTDFNAAFGFFVQTAGILWFVRGCSLMAEASNPGTQRGSKGLLFLIGGILAVNFDYTAGMIDGALSWLENATMSASKSLGY